MSHAPPRPTDILRIVTVLLLMALPSCRPDTVTSPTVTGVSFAKGGGGGPNPKVDATDPPGAPQDITLDVRVLGQGFDEGSVAVWTIDGVEQPEVQTNSTTFVSKEELVANVTIQEDAAIDLYDVEVTTSRGKKGIGADLFSVVKKGTPTFTTVALEPVDGSDNSIAWAVNDVGQVAGLSLARRGVDDRPTRWTVDEASGSVTTLALDVADGWFSSAAWGISDGSIVVGAAVEDETSKQKAVWWDIDGSAHTFEPGAAANDVSSFGTGWIAVGRDDWVAVYWMNGDSPIELHPVETGASSVANAVNSAGTIAGRSGGSAVVWHPDTEGAYGSPCVLEADAEVHGISEPTGEGFVYAAGSWNTSVDPMGAVWLVDPDAANCLVSARRLDKSSELYGVSSGGDAVGEGWDSAHHAILWTNDGVFGLPGLNDGGKGALWARGISSDGLWIVGASDAPKNSRRGVLWIRR